MSTKTKKPSPKKAAARTTAAPAAKPKRTPDPAPTVVEQLAGAPEPTTLPVAAAGRDTTAPATDVTLKRLSALDAAAKVLAEADAPMTAPALIEAMAANGHWTSPGGKTPAATLHAALQREIAVKGSAARFRKTGRGVFTVTRA
jgi:hypothetical protein